MDVSRREIARACQMVRGADVSGRSPSAVVAWVLWEVSGRTQTECADAAGTSVVSLRNCRDDVSEQQDC
jgi:transcription initiation factor TFIIIB Brf1 subunit/transcription initiation factor TFIIB